MINILFILIDVYSNIHLSKIKLASYIIIFYILFNNQLLDYYILFNNYYHLKDFFH
jgi:hypothetical protein